MHHLVPRGAHDRGGQPRPHAEGEQGTYDHGQARGGEEVFAALSKLPLALHPPGIGDHQGPHLPGRADCPTAGEGEVPPALLVLKYGSGAEECAQGGGGVPGVDDGGERPCSAHSTRLWRGCGQ